MADEQQADSGHSEIIRRAGWSARDAEREIRACPDRRDGNWSRDLWAWLEMERARRPQYRGDALSRWTCWTRSLGNRDSCVQWWSGNWTSRRRSILRSARAARQLGHWRWAVRVASLPWRRPLRDRKPLKRLVCPKLRENSLIAAACVSSGRTKSHNLYTGKNGTEIPFSERK